uniref:Ig-like domain-containing protein n=1 Tax=Dromaius novaehollandiae TaxID=8790 RepID=A0A8C4J0K4_DRONO
MLGSELGLQCSFLSRACNARLGAGLAMLVFQLCLLTVLAMLGSVLGLQCSASSRTCNANFQAVPATLGFEPSLPRSASRCPCSARLGVTLANFSVGSSRPRPRGVWVARGPSAGRQKPAGAPRRGPLRRRPSPAVSAQAPVVYPLKPCACDEVNVTVACFVSSYFPQPATVSWVSSTAYDALTYPAVVGDNSLYSFSSQLTTPVSNLEGNDIQCNVEHKPTLRQVLRQPSHTAEPGQRQPEKLGSRGRVALENPSLDALYLSQEANLTCVAANVKTPSGISFSWQRQKATPLDVVHGEAVKQDNGLYRVTSAAKVCAEDWNSGETFSCTVSGSELPSSITKSSKKNLGRSSPFPAPTVLVLPPSPEELALGETATLTCLATRFNPKDILVTWTQQDRSVPAGSFTVFGPEEDGDGYTVYSKLSIPAEEWQRGDSFACVVGHEGNPVTFVHKSLDKASGKPAAVNISVVLADAELTCY